MKNLSSMHIFPCKHAISILSAVPYKIFCRKLILIDWFVGDYYKLLSKTIPPQGTQNWSGAKSTKLDFTAHFIFQKQYFIFIANLVLQYTYKLSIFQ